MTVNLQVLAKKSEVKVATRYKNFKAVAMRCTFTKLSAVKNELPGKRFQLFDQEHPTGK